MIVPPGPRLDALIARLEATLRDATPKRCRVYARCNRRATTTITTRAHDKIPACARCADVWICLGGSVPKTPRRAKRKAPRQR